MWKYTALIITAMLGGCASFSYLGESYSALQPQIVTTKADTWRVFDRTAEGKLLVQRNPGNPTASGVVGALGLATTNAAAPQPDYREAAEAFLAQTGRGCRIKDGYLVVAPSWEFTYECDKAPVTAGAQAKQ
ncbi:MAG: hypothetical protein K2X43_03960 [Hyphomonadaceae bacterium]|jgi:hypothetical protein|nr:hypothetical protein [Hyphomonadaceae bacterium]